MKMLRDRFNREIDYLRVSVTDRCNLRCVYCLPCCGVASLPHKEILSFEEIARIAAAGASLGIDKVRLTGGEPLVRKGIAGLVYMLSEIKGVEEISMTTNGVLLGGYAKELKRAGLGRVNVSLDTLRPDRFGRITGGGALEEVIGSIERALECGFDPLKINVLLMAGVNDDEIGGFLRLTVERPVHVRFLELMPMGTGAGLRHKETFLSCGMIKEACRSFGDIEPAEVRGNGPSVNYRVKNALGTFGLIAPVSERFCGSCNRLRLTSEGFLKACLHSDEGSDIKGPVRRGAGEKELAALIALCAAGKPEGHSLDKAGHEPSERLMHRIGG